MSPGREVGALESWVEKRGGYRGSLGSLLLSAHPTPGSIRPPRPRAGHVFGLPSQAPGALT